MASGAVIWMHGLGDEGKSWASLEDTFKRRYKGNVKFMFPDAPHDKVTVNGGMVMRSWFDLLDIPLTPESRDCPKSIERSVQRINGLIAECEKEGIPSNRIILGGFSQGGALTIQTVMRSEKKLAAGVVLSGWVLMPKEIDKWMKDANRDTPLFWGHGTADPLVLCQMQDVGAALLRDKGASVECRQYRGLPHGFCADEETDVLRFIASTLGIEEK